MLDQKNDALLIRLCRNCIDVLLSSHDENLSDYLEAMGSPAVLVSRDLTVLVATRAFSRMFAKLDQNLMGMRIGEILGCSYANTLGLCGETAACWQCTLKRIVEIMCITGDRLPLMTLDLWHDTRGRIKFTVRAEKVGSGVLLVVEASTQN